MSLTSDEIKTAVEGLIAKRLVSDESGFNSRANKFQHRFCNTEFGDFHLTKQEKGIACCMLLRGAQTPGELRTRTSRLCEFSDVKEVEQVLTNMAEREGPLVVKLPREAGKRESRYQHLFCGEVDISELETAMPTNAKDARIAELEQEVAELKAKIVDLESQLG